MQIEGEVVSNDMETGFYGSQGEKCGEKKREYSGENFMPIQYINLRNIEHPAKVIHKL